MTWTLSDYLDAAIARLGLRSDRELGFRLGFTSGTQVWRYRRKGDFPTPETMVDLAQMAGRDAKVALAELGLWKAETDRARSVYLEIIKSLTKGALVAVVAGLSIFAPLDANAAAFGTKLEQRACDPLRFYIMGNLRRVLRHLAEALTPRANALA